MGCMDVATRRAGSIGSIAARVLWHTPMGLWRAAAAGRRRLLRCCRHHGYHLGVSEVLSRARDGRGSCHMRAGPWWPHCRIRRACVMIGSSATSGDERRGGGRALEVAGTRHACACRPTVRLSVRRAHRCVSFRMVLATARVRLPGAPAVVMTMVRVMMVVVVVAVVVVVSTIQHSVARLGRRWLVITTGAAAPSASAASSAMLLTWCVRMAIGRRHLVEPRFARGRLAHTRSGCAAAIASGRSTATRAARAIARRIVQPRMRLPAALAAHHWVGSGGTRGARRGVIVAILHLIARAELWSGRDGTGAPRSLPCGRPRRLRRQCSDEQHVGGCGGPSSLTGYRCDGAGAYAMGGVCVRAWHAHVASARWKKRLAR